MRTVQKHVCVLNFEHFWLIQLREKKRREKLERLLRIEYNVVTLYSAYTVDFIFFNCLIPLFTAVVLYYTYKKQYCDVRN